MQRLTIAFDLPDELVPWLDRGDPWGMADLLLHPALPAYGDDRDADLSFLLSGIDPDDFPEGGLDQTARFAGAWLRPTPDDGEEGSALDHLEALYHAIEEEYRGVSPEAWPAAVGPAIRFLVAAGRLQAEARAAGLPEAGS